jgi:hypothetical protein
VGPVRAGPVLVNTALQRGDLRLVGEQNYLTSFALTKFRSKCHIKGMKPKFSKVIVLSAVSLVAVFAYVAVVRAQQSKSNAKSAAASITTNWVGYLVAGRNDTVDSIAVGGPHPTVMGHLEIGVRSDGLLVCRNAAVAR